MRFLHCLRKFEYLCSALTHGLMFTDHKVRFKLTEDNDKYSRLVFEYAFPILENKLQSLGKPFSSLGEGRKSAILSGIGPMSGDVPMLCFTEIPDGKKITNHCSIFGEYGLVIRRNWIECNGGDRVIYIGENSPLSIKLFKFLFSTNIMGMHTNSHGNEPVYETAITGPFLDVFSFIETREHLEEAEWRVVGNHGFMGGKRDTGNKLPLKLSDIECIFAPTTSEIQQLSTIVAKLAAHQSCSNPPVVICTPEQIP